MKPYHKAILIAIVAMLVVRFVPSIFKHKSRIEAGQVYQYANTKIYNPGVVNDIYETDYDIHVVYKVVGDQIYYVSNGTDSAFCDEKTFLFNSVRIK